MSEEKSTGYAEERSFLDPDDVIGASGTETKLLSRGGSENRKAQQLLRRQL